MQFNSSWFYQWYYTSRYYFSRTCCVLESGTFITIITPLEPCVQMSTGNAVKVTSSLWRRCSKPHTAEKWIWLIRFETEMGASTCVHRPKAYLTFTIIATHRCWYIWIHLLHLLYICKNFLDVYKNGGVYRKQVKPNYQ